MVKIRPDRIRNIESGAVHAAPELNDTGKLRTIIYIQEERILSNESSDLKRKPSRKRLYCDSA